MLSFVIGGGFVTAIDVVSDAVSFVVVFHVIVIDLIFVDDDDGYLVGPRVRGGWTNSQRRN